MRDLNARQTQDRNVVIQRPIRDSRPRYWRWAGYPIRLSIYNNLWQTLESLDVKQRLTDGFSPTVEVWENATDAGFGETTDGLAPDLVGYSNLEWVEVKFVSVTRKVRDRGGLVTFDTSEIEFYITDADWERF